MVSVHVSLSMGSQCVQAGRGRVVVSRSSELLCAACNLRLAGGVGGPCQPYLIGHA
jgi:hypothetical protein